jgi:E3 ubiquitin-protein ligase TRIP12
MTIAGSLCAQAFAMDTVVAFSFNPEFFSLARENPVELEAVDPALARSLADLSGLIGLPFTYPGIPNLEIRRDEITAENAAEFVSLVRQFTVGGRARAAAIAFRQGFERVIPWSAMDVFSCEELTNLFRGSSCSFTREELRRNIEACHGYRDDAPQVEMLLDALLEFGDEERARFVRFVTGARALPIGWLSALRPKLTVALRISESGAEADTTFPSVMTCANYLKLPQYSCKEVLIERLRYAIAECQNTFGLT